MISKVIELKGTRELRELARINYTWLLFIIDSKNFLTSLGGTFGFKDLWEQIQEISRNYLLKSFDLLLYTKEYMGHNVLALKQH